MNKPKVGLIAFQTPVDVTTFLKQLAQNSYLMANVELPLPQTRLKLINGQTQKSQQKIVFDQRQLPIPIGQANRVLGETMAIASFVSNFIFVIDQLTPMVKPCLDYVFNHFADAKRRVIYRGKLMTFAQFGQAVNDALQTSASANDVFEPTTESTMESTTKSTPMDDHRSTTTANEPMVCLKSPNGAQLFSYQQQMVDFALKVKRAGLFVDMGLGKTFATLATIDQLVKTKQIDATKPILIVAPKMVALDTWSREAAKWGYDFDVAINIELTPKKRLALLDSLLQPCQKVTLLTTNPEQLKPIKKYYEQHGITLPFSMVIVDELSQYKNGQTMRFKMLKTFSDKVDYFIGLTGTPNPNDLLDLWSQLILIDPKMGDQLGHSFFQYRQRFFYPGIKGADGTVYSWDLKPRSKDTIYRSMKSNVISMLSDGLVDLPQITYDNRYVTLSKHAQTVYDRLDQTLRDEIKRDGASEYKKQGDGLAFTVSNSAVLAARLMQVTSGAIYDGVANLADDISDDQLAVESQHYTIVDERKMNMLKDIIDNATSPILVFFQYRSELLRMKDAFDFTYLDPHQKDVTQTIADWNAGKIPVLVAHPAAAGHGLNLQDGGHIMVWYTTTWSNEQYRQAVKRLYRRGQKYPVSVIHLIAKHTIDEEVVARLKIKEAQQQDLMQNLQAPKP